MIEWEIRDFMELSEEILSRAHYLRFRMRGASMLPFLKDNDLIVIKKFIVSDIRPGDIIFFRPQFYEGVTHRVIKKIVVNGRTAFITKGDFCPFPDGYVYPEQILGRLVAIERNGKNINLDNKTIILKSLLYAKILCFEVWVYAVLRKLQSQIKHKLLGGLLRRLQAMRIYGFLIRIFVEEEKISYRLATQDDASSLARLYGAYYWPTKPKLLVRYFQWYLKEISKNRGFCFLPHKGSKVIGSVAVKNFSENEITPSGWGVYNLFVNWRYRGIGIEKRLVELATQKAKEQGATEVKIVHFKKMRLTFD